MHHPAALVLRSSIFSAPAGTATEEHAATFLRFRAAVERTSSLIDVAYYARQLGYSPRTLTRASLAAAGIGAKEFLDRRVVLEAKRLLAHSDDPVAAIAAELGFPDASNFVKYFALRADATPATFRHQFRTGSA